MAKKNNYNTPKENVTSPVVEENTIVEEKILENNTEVEETTNTITNVIIPKEEELNGHKDPVREPGKPGIIEEESKDTPKEVTEEEIPESDDGLDNEVDQNFKIGAELKLVSLKSDLDELVRKNPELGSVKKVNEMLSKPEGMSISLYKLSTNSMEVSLMEKRDYYEIGGFEGQYMPKEADLGFYKSPQKSFNLALDQVKILIEKGYKLKNNRTGDVIKKRNVDEYISKWSKDKNPIISNKVYY